ncbi:hypothetical protein [Streptomyces lomondensis]|uniref:Uncharacterized protein n=1 Tax=Streptomyces lomondensis TaxID=68229 RepID=A0ABQ2X1N1_9ACTN|nr:hypothetical protein [Streptomyces lomondensis]MCF0081631.1 hypothetical protein [Streptomyces lomondensis]GGW92223.1 hypothetical protein GCM10010383_22610 [Streptomyces lomondensis]
MNDKEVGVSVDEHVYQFDFKSGWLDLTLESVDWVDAWAVATVLATTQFEPSRLTVTTRKLTRELRRLALDLNREESNLAAARYTPEGQVVADFRQDTYGEEGKPRPSPVEVVPLLLQSVGAAVVTEPDVRHLSLEVGPTVRVRADLNKKGRFGLGRKRAAGLIKYAMFPPGLGELSVVTVRLWQPKEADEVTCLADELVATARMVPADTEEHRRGA